MSSTPAATKPPRVPVAAQPAAISAVSREAVVTWLGVSPRRAHQRAMYREYGLMKKVVKKPSRDFTADFSRTASSSTAATACRASLRACGSAGTAATRLPSSGRCTSVPSASSAAAMRSGRPAASRTLAEAPAPPVPATAEFSRAMARVRAWRPAAWAVTAPGIAAIGKRGSVSPRRRACTWPTKAASTTATRSPEGTWASSVSASAGPEAVRTSKPRERRSPSSVEPGTG
ncbi:hypothetical protein GCM10009601_33250 [Streptomyces thermospinosisporus]|uniref:Uncharacterized protein n=1 Tax=Streptomyces thermospinosisporus TaxID=161482 RepID=A0ABN1YZ21_9ACTN